MCDYVKNHKFWHTFPDFLAYFLNFINETKVGFISKTRYLCYASVIKPFRNWYLVWDNYYLFDFYFIDRFVHEKPYGTLIDDIERGYEWLYLCKHGSLKESYEQGLPPPRFDFGFHCCHKLLISIIISLRP